MTSSVVDLAILGVLGAFALWGIVAGGIRIAGPFVVATAAVLLAQAYPDIVRGLRSGPGLPAYVLLKLLAILALVAYGVLARFIHRAVHASGLGVFNRLLGAALGGVTGVVVAGTVVWALDAFGTDEIRAALGVSDIAATVRLAVELLATAAKQLFEAQSQA